MARPAAPTGYLPIWQGPDQPHGTSARHQAGCRCQPYRLDHHLTKMTSKADITVQGGRMTQPLTEHSISMPRHEASVATARPHDQADALAALRRIHDHVIYGPDISDAWGSSHDELASLVDVIDAEVLALELYDDDYSEPAERGAA